MIKIVKGTFGYRKGRTIEPKTCKSEPFSIDPKREAELVEAGIAVYVEPTGDIDNDGNFVVDGEVIGHVEGEHIVITDEEVIAEPLANEAEEDNEEASADVEVTLEYLEELKLDELKEFAAQFGVSYKVGTKKADFVKEVWEAIDVEPEEEDNEEAPTFDAGNAVV